jgi:hypothetical protein
MEEWFRRFEVKTKHGFGMSPRTLAQHLTGLSFAEVEEFGSDVLRRIILNEPESNVKSVVKNCLSHWKKRFSPSSFSESKRKA